MLKKIFPLIASALAVALLSACYHDKHEFIANEFGGQPVGYVALQLMWDNEADADATLKSITFQAFGADDIVSSRTFTSVEEAAAWLQQLPVGNYDILVAANMDEASGYVLTTGSGTRSAARLTTTSVALADYNLPPSQSWFAVTNVTISEGDITVAQIRLRRLLSSLAITISEVPEGYSLTASVEHTAQGVILSETDSSGRYGVASADEQAVECGLLATDGTNHSLTRRFMPTASSQERTIISIEIATPEGTSFKRIINAPAMLIGQDHSLNIRYSELQSVIYINSTNVNDWNIGTILDGGSAEGTK